VEFLSTAMQDIGVRLFDSKTREELLVQLIPFLVSMALILKF